MMRRMDYVLVNLTAAFLQVLTVLGGVVLVAAVGATVHMVVRLRKNLRKFTYRLPETAPLLSDLPSVTVCVPARNEAHALTSCLERVLASDYPKLEVLVVDDNSIDNTSVLLRSFAQAGVRFIEGTPPPEGWLGRNHAVAELARNANGSLVFFIDADTQLSVSTISQAVQYMSVEAVDMVSIVPRRASRVAANTALQSLQQFWEVIFHTKAHPGASSSAWVIRRDNLVEAFSTEQQLGGTLRLEAALATTLSQHDRYRMVLADHGLGLVHERRYGSIVRGGVRLLYPFLRMRLGGWAFWYITVVAVLPLSAIVQLWIAAVVAASFGTVGVPNSIIAVASLVVSLSMALCGVLFVRHIWSVRALLLLVLWPFILLQEWLLFVVSALQYKTGTVRWKGRAVTLPPQAE